MKAKAFVLFHVSLQMLASFDMMSHERFLFIDLNWEYFVKWLCLHSTHGLAFISQIGYPIYWHLVCLHSLDGVRTTIPVGDECVINIDPSDAGEGRVTCRIGSTSDSDVDIDILDNGDGTVSVVYTPRKPGAYALEIKFGGKTIPNGKFTQNVSLFLCHYNNINNLVWRHCHRVAPYKM